MIAVVTNVILGVVCLGLVAAYCYLRRLDLKVRETERVIDCQFALNVLQLHLAQVQAQPEDPKAFEN